MLYFSTGDQPTDHNLQRLNHLSSLDRFDGTPEHMHDWLCAAISSIKMLPRAAARHFVGNYFLGDAHFRMSAEQRADTWRKLAEELRDHVTAAHADPALRHNGPNGPLQTSSRRETRGERIIALCDKLERASWGTPEFDSVLSGIGALAVAGIQSDVSNLRRLSARKRIPDISEHKYSIARDIAHIRLLANRLHHLD